MARVDGLEMFAGPLDRVAMEVAVNRFLSNRDLSPDDVDLLISGRSGDGQLQETWDNLEALFTNSDVAAYKHLVGEYDTASSFASFLGIHALRGRGIPPSYYLRKSARTVARVLVMNTMRDRSLSMILMCSPF